MRKYVLIFTMIFSCFTLLAQHGPVIPMDSLQYVDDSSLAAGSTDPIYFNYGDTVTVEGVVTFNPWFYGMSTDGRRATWLQNESLEPWTAMNVFIDPNPSGLPTWSYKGGAGTLDDLKMDTKFMENLVPG